MRAWATQHGRTPRASDWRHAGDEHPSAGTVSSVFEGGWRAAIQAAGLSPVRVRVRWPAEVLIDLVRADHARLGHLPTVAEWIADPTRPSSFVASIRFGSWLNMVELAGFEPRRRGLRLSFEHHVQPPPLASGRPREWDARRVAAALRVWAHQHGRVPRRRDWLRTSALHPEGAVVYRLFGSWPAALQAAGLDVPSPGPPQRTGGWDADAVVEAVIAWTQRFGDPPAVADWNPALARRRGEHDRADLFERERPRWPVASAVVYHCGAWNTALQTAGQRSTSAGLKRTAPRPLASLEGEHTHAWTREECLRAIRAHIVAYGRPPRYDDWRPGDPAGLRPSTRVLVRLFGSFSRALDAALANATSTSSSRS